MTRSLKIRTLPKNTVTSSLVNSFRSASIKEMVREIGMLLAEKEVRQWREDKWIFDKPNGVAEWLANRMESL
jgi:hypothetical protein